MIVIGVVCVPKFIMESNKKQGHGYFDNEMPEDVRKSRERRYKYLTIQFIFNMIHDMSKRKTHISCIIKFL